MDRLDVIELDAWVDAPAVAAALDAPSFWLDSGRSAYGSGRFSYLGDARESLTYRIGEGVVVERDGHRTYEAGTILDALARRVPAPGAAPDDAAAPDDTGAADVPFDLRGGWVGYLGYEVGADLGLDLRGHRSPHPDAVWLRAERYVALDHEQRRAFVVTARDQGDWAQRLISRLRRPESPSAPADPDATSGTAPDVAPAPDADDLAAAMRRGPRRYLADVEECLAALRRGESYEICLTDTLTWPARPDADPLAAYLALRQANPAPYAALLRLPGLAVLCSSPERFLRVTADGHVTSKPIKGTAARDPHDAAADVRAAAALAADPKTRAENLMIVDLVRNDLWRACTDVHVDPFCAVETCATVHQVVSTVHGTLRPGCTALDAVAACFPSGSMTGAPKHRSMQVIGDLEGAARGVYSGTVGYLSGDGAADLNVVIRTAVLAEDTVTVGAGGAIVLDSDPAAELDEALLKAAAPLRGLAPLLAPTTQRHHEEDPA